MRALITGATGFVGRQLLKEISEPVVLSRDPLSARKRLPRTVEVHAWDPVAGPPPARAFEGIAAVFHLAGEPVAEGRWSPEKKRRIRESRVLGTMRLVSAMEGLKERPKVLVSASAVGYYGSRGDEILDESSRPGRDFLSEVCYSWEEMASKARGLGIRVVNIRTGVVLGRDGGALPRMLMPFKIGIGGRLGGGRQWMPWIHVADVVGLFRHAAMHVALNGPMNACAPVSVTNREFTRTLAKALHRPAILPMPALALQLVLGEFSHVLLSSQRVVPRVAKETGYEFQYPELAGALAQILGPANASRATSAHTHLAAPR